MQAVVRARKGVGLAGAARENVIWRHRFSRAGFKGGIHPPGRRSFGPCQGDGGGAFGWSVLREAPWDQVPRRCSMTI